MLSFVIGCVGMLFSSGVTPDATLPATDTLWRPLKANKIQVDTTQKIRINRILIIGNKITREQIIMR